MSIHYEKGRYRLAVIGAALGESSKGTPQVELQVEVGDGSGPPRRVYMSLTEGTLGTPQSPGWVWDRLVDLGFVGPSFSDLEPLIGAVRDGECKHEAGDDGVMREKWQIFGSMSKPKNEAKPQTIRQLDSKFGGLLRSGKSGGQQPQPRAVQPQQTQAPRRETQVVARNDVGRMTPVDEPGDAYEPPQRRQYRNDEDSIPF